MTNDSHKIRSERSPLKPEEIKYLSLSPSQEMNTRPSDYEQQREFFNSDVP